jgi:glycosyltransferase involved in cell wall biosynthesis
MQVNQFVVSLSFGDAISNAALCIQSLLRDGGYVSEIFAESTDSAMAGSAQRLWDYGELTDPENVLIVHFSIGSSLTTLLNRLEDKILLIYHNITPPEWFHAYAPRVAEQCRRGRHELAQIADRVSLALGVSEYNRRELDAMGFERTGVLPLPGTYERLTVPPNPVVRRLFDDEMTNFLFVGRVMPNKCFEDLLKVFAVYQKHIDPKCRLLLVGDNRVFEKYTLSLMRLADRMRLNDVIFTDRVKTDELVAYYLSGDVFLCMSEHEGFCAPLLEAFRFEMPVIGYDAGAVGETLGGGGILVQEKNYAEIAELAYRVTHDPRLRESILVGQRRVLDVFAARDQGETLLQYVKQVASGGV